MDTQVMRAAVFGMANPFTGKQAPDHQARGFATQSPLESETKYFPFAKHYNKHRPSNVMVPLPEFPLGVNPTFSRQEGSQESVRGKEVPNIKGDNRVLSADLVEMYAKIEARHRDAPGPLSGDYQGSPWAYGALYGLPIGHPTNASNFIAEYGEALSDQEWHRRTEQLVKEGYEPERIHKAMEDHVNDYLRKRLATKSGLSISDSIAKKLATR